MKKFLFAFCLLLISSYSFSQTCEDRQSKLLEAIGSFSAATLYNTYSTLGCIADGFGSDVYSAEMVSNLITAQSTLADNLIKVLEGLKTSKSLTAQSDLDYASSCIDIIKGLKKQAQLILNYTKNKSQANLDLYDTQRTKNWKDISQLMGIKD